MLDKSICYFRESGLFCCFYSIFDGKILLANNADPDQMPHYVASDLGLHCLPMSLLWFPGKNGLKGIIKKLFKIIFFCGSDH